MHHVYTFHDVTPTAIHTQTLCFCYTKPCYVEIAVSILVNLPGNNEFHTRAPSFISPCQQNAENWTFSQFSMRFSDIFSFCWHSPMFYYGINIRYGMQKKIYFIINTRRATVFELSWWCAFHRNECCVRLCCTLSQSRIFIYSFIAFRFYATRENFQRRRNSQQKPEFFRWILIFFFCLAEFSIEFYKTSHHTTFLRWTEQNRVKSELNRTKSIAMAMSLDDFLYFHPLANKLNKNKSDSTQKVNCI